MPFGTRRGGQTIIALPACSLNEGDCGTGGWRWVARAEAILKGILVVFQKVYLVTSVPAPDAKFKNMTLKTVLNEHTFTTDMSVTNK